MRRLKISLAQLVVAVDLKSIGCGFESRTGYLKFSGGSLTGEVLDCDSSDYGFKPHSSHGVVNSTVECLVYTEEVMGSNPVLLIIL